MFYDLRRDLLELGDQGAQPELLLLLLSKDSKQARHTRIHIRCVCLHTCIRVYYTVDSICNIYSYASLIHRCLIYISHHISYIYSIASSYNLRAEMLTFPCKFEINLCHPQVKQLKSPKRHLKSPRPGGISPPRIEISPDPPAAPWRTHPPLAPRKRCGYDIKTA